MTGSDDSKRWPTNQAGFASPDIRISTANFDDPVHAQAIVEIVNAYAMEPQGGGKSLPDDVPGVVESGDGGLEFS